MGPRLCPEKIFLSMISRYERQSKINLHVRDHNIFRSCIREVAAALLMRTEGVRN